MASFRVNDVELKYGIDSFEETKNTYYWLEKAAFEWSGSQVSLKIDFNFYLGNISCSAEGIEEFIEIAYGGDQYKLISFNGSFEIGKKKIYINYLGDLSVSTNTKTDLESFLKILNNTSLEEVKDSSTITYIEKQNNIIAQGDNNNIIANSSNVSINTQNKDSKLHNWFVSIMQNLASNWIWYLLTVICSAIGTYFLTKG